MMCIFLPKTEILAFLIFVSPAELCVQHTVCLPEGLVLEKERRRVFSCRPFRGTNSTVESHFGLSLAPFRDSSLNGYLIKGIKVWLFASIWENLKASLALEFPKESPKLVIGHSMLFDFSLTLIPLPSSPFPRSWYQGIASWYSWNTPSQTLLTEELNL